MPFYRIVVADIQSPRDGRFIEILGTYDPLKETDKMTLKKDRALHWLKEGAKPTDTVKSLFKKSDLFRESTVQETT